MKKFCLNPFLLSLAISFNAQWPLHASYDPGGTEVLEYSDDGGVMLQSITINAEDVSKFNEINDYEEEEQHENFNNSAQQNNESFTPIAEEESTPEKKLLRWRGEKI